MSTPDRDGLYTSQYFTSFQKEQLFELYSTPPELRKNLYAIIKSTDIQNARLEKTLKGQSPKVIAENEIPPVFPDNVANSVRQILHRIDMKQNRNKIIPWGKNY